MASVRPFRRGAAAISFANLGNCSPVPAAESSLREASHLQIQLFMRVIGHRSLASRLRRADVARFFYVVASTFLIVTAMIFARTVVLPIVTAILLTFVLAPLVIFLQSKGLPRVLAVLAVVILVFLILGGIVTSIVHQMASLASELPGYRHQIMEKIESMRHVGEHSLPNSL